MRRELCYSLPLEAIYNEARRDAIGAVRTMCGRAPFYITCDFKIGITEGTAWRFHEAPYAYKLPAFGAWSRIEALCCVTAAEARILETRLIRYFLNTELRVNGVTLPGECKNVLAGGDGVSPDNPKPIFVYIVLKEAVL